MQQPCSDMDDATGEAYVDIRVCDLLVQQGNMPKGLDSGFQIDGLYVVLRCREEVRRTSCLWPSVSGASAKERQSSDTQPDVAAGTLEEQNEDDLVWNEMFRFVVPPALQPIAPVATPLGPHSPPSAHGGDSQGGFCAPYTLPFHPSGSSNGTDGGARGLPYDAALPMCTSAVGGIRGPDSSGFALSYSPPPSFLAIPTSPLRSAVAQPQPSGGGNSSRATEAGVGNSPSHYPSIELELWRSTPLSENLLGCYTYHLPIELMQGGYDLSTLDAVVERVVLLRTKEAPSIMGNLYGWSEHRLSLRLRVQAVGLAPLMAAWSPQQGSKAMPMTAANMTGSGAYPGPFSAGMPDGTVAGASPYAAASVYGTTFGTLNPVLANLLAPLGVSMGGSAVQHVPPGGMMSISGGIGGDHLQKPGEPPFLSMLPPFQTAAPVGGTLFHPHLPGAPSATPQSPDQGILGDGDLTWQSSITQPTVYSPYGLPQKR
ncbi:hypothetical protein Q4I32_006216 [Leishmania shawi]|uniref:C2 domain-containing protein n=1 Tax=Leishmania shawi TaxID=5680 RepID=A0AAW3BCB1_9TRYP